MSTARMRQAMEPLISTEDKPLPKRKKHKKSRALTDVNDFTDRKSEEIFAAIIDFIKNEIVENQTLSDASIKSLVALSLTCHSMHKLLRITNINSPLYNLPTEFLISRMQSLLAAKDNDNSIIPLSEVLETVPNYVSKLRISNNLLRVLIVLSFVLPLAITITLASLKMLPGVETMAETTNSYLTTYAYYHYEKTSSEFQELISARERFFAAVLVTLYSLGGCGVLLIPSMVSGYQLDKLLQANAYKDLKKMNYPTKELVQEYKKALSTLSDSLDKNSPAIRRQTLTLFTKVNTLTTFNALNNNSENIEAKAPQLNN